ncbi:uncharacterized protein YybS [Ureibacillus xyleni]|uniref:Uncharacterized protein YybS n=1 Tax=Ureibacillus xyleni TaxID=614648 RepID=A0A285SLE9_9BACL|nr:YybS family protein [Ureibacillus xyleni]SOC08160.1 uncharacterized protein YybS [Ureibacillus xyleni]
MPNNQTKKLVNGAMMVALFSILIAIAFYVPIVNLVAIIFAPLPLAWYSAKFDRGSAILVAIMGCISSFFIGSILIIPLAVICASIGVVMGDALRLKKSKVYLLMSSGITVLITFALQYVISIKLLNTDFIKEAMQMTRNEYEKSIELSQRITGQAPIDEKTLNQMFDTMQMALPAAIVLGVFFLTFIIVTSNLPLLKRFGVNVPKFNTFKNLRLPRSILWYYLILLSINLFISPETGSPLYVICLNLSMVLWLLLTLQGISFIHFCLDAYGSPSILKVLATIMAIPLYSFVLLIGIFDLGFDIRSFVKGKIQR